jgi:pimeloyl-ACP methyl ester carboxylesterase
LGRIVLVTRIQRPDGVEIHWEARGEGPTVLLTHHSLWSYPGVYKRLIADLAGDHRVLLYDPRGCGRSSRRGPYDMDTDADDLRAVLEDAGGADVAIGVGDGFNRAARVGASRADLLSRLIAIAPGAAGVLPRAELKGSGVMAASDSVIALLQQMMITDPRAALRSVLAAINPDLDEGELRERVECVSEYLDFEAASDRATSWLADDVSTHVSALGDRVWILHGGPDPMFEGALGERVRKLFPEAHLEQLEDGPISRPELTSERVRRLTHDAP